MSAGTTLAVEPSTAPPGPWREFWGSFSANRGAVIGLQVGVLFTGAILTETIFSWPGVGKWLIEAIGRRDYPVLQGGMLLLGVIVMIVNLSVDLAYGFINPRIRR